MEIADPKSKTNANQIVPQLHNHAKRARQLHVYSLN